jgi:hypothetical protein
MDHPHLFQSATPVHPGERFGLKKEGEKILSAFFQSPQRGRKRRRKAIYKERLPGPRQKKHFFDIT